MKTAYIFHDAFCDPTSDWYPWMKTKLEAMGYFVVVPKFPTPAGQSYDSWKAVINNYMGKFDSESLVIGHGAGGTFALRIIEELSVQVRAVFLVASYAEPLGHIGYDRVNESFFKHEFNWEKIKNNSQTTRVIAGEADPFVPPAITDHLAEKLDTSAIIIPSGEHINKASGFTQCIPVIHEIQESLKVIDKSISLENSDPIPSPSSWQEEGNRTTEIKSSVSPSFRGGASGDSPGGGVVHTMYQDMSKLVHSNSGKVASSLLGKAHQEEAAKKVNQPLTTTNSLYIVGTIATILISLGILVTVMARNASVQKNTILPDIPSLLQAEQHKKISITGKQPYDLEQEILNMLAKKELPDTFSDVYYTDGNLRASFTAVLENLENSSLPETLTREFITAGFDGLPVFMHGVIHLEKPAHFLILPITNYDQAFQGMRDWEATLVHDVGIFMNMDPTLLKTRISRDLFSDEMVANRQLRILRNPDGNLVLAYFFLNDKTVIITDSLDGIPILLTRYANRQIYQN